MDSLPLFISCLATLESMRDMLEQLRIEREAETGLKCEIDEDKFEVGCLVPGDDDEGTGYLLYYVQFHYTCIFNCGQAILGFPTSFYKY